MCPAYQVRWPDPKRPGSSLWWGWSWSKLILIHSSHTADHWASTEQQQQPCCCCQWRKWVSQCWLLLLHAWTCYSREQRDKGWFWWFWSGRGERVKYQANILIKYFDFGIKNSLLRIKWVLNGWGDTICYLIKILLKVIPFLITWLTRQTEIYVSTVLKSQTLHNWSYCLASWSTEVISSDQLAEV